MRCKVCNSEFEGRSDALYCSAKCRVTANRRKRDSVTDNVTANLSGKEKFEGFELPDRFSDLPEGVQLTISRLSDGPEEFRRRAIMALGYQKMFPNNVHKGVPFGLG